MVSNIRDLDPVQGLVDYVNDIKPYHTKVIESLVEYVGQENIDIILAEEYMLNVDLAYTYDINVLTCLNGGFDALAFDDPDSIPILSPDLTKTVSEFPAFTSNSFIVVGDQRELFDPSSNLTFKIASFFDDRIIDVTVSTGSPLSGGEFYLLGNKTSQFPTGTVFVVTGSDGNDGAYKVTSSSTYNVGDNTTTIHVDTGQNVSSDIVSGFIRIPDSNNVGTFSIVSSIFTAGTSKISPYTTVFVSGITFVPPSIPTGSPESINPKYISLVSTGAIEYKRILSYSNILKYYTGSPASLLQAPNEGIIYTPIVNLSNGSPNYFIVEGNFENSNVFIGDVFTVEGSSGNNTSYTIESIEIVFEPLINDYATKFGVANITDSNIDGFIKLNIPSNVFIVDGNYEDFFKQGTKVKVISGSKTGTYTTLNSNFINGETQIRVLEDIIEHGRGRLIIGNGNSACGSPLLNGFIVEGDVTSTFKQGTQFNITLSVRNDGSYTTVDSIYCPSTHSTTISVIEPYDTTDTTGELHEFTKGSLMYVSTGFGETPELCEVVPETIIKVGIKDKLYIDNMGIWSYDDIISHGQNDEGWGFELPYTTIFASGSVSQPDIMISDTAPVSPLPTEDTLWFDTSSNSDVLSAPGTLKQYSFLLDGSPTEGWVTVPHNKAYWIDTDTGYMYYRLIYQYYDDSVPEYPTPTIENNLDTGWILEYTDVPGYNAITTGHGSREQIGFETFFAVETSTSVAGTTYDLSTLTIPLVGSPAVPNSLMLEVYVNNTPAVANILSATSFEITTPKLRVGDFIEARVFDTTRIPSSTFVGGFETNAAIVETFDMLKGYKFHIDGTDSSTKQIYIPDTQAGDIFNIFKPSIGSPATPTLVDTLIEIADSVASPSNDGIYTIVDVTQSGSPNSYVVLTVAETLLDTGIFGGSPLIESGKVLYQQWYQYLIVNTTLNTIVVLGDATGDITGGSPVDSIKISHSYGSPTNDGTYTVSVAPTFDGRNTTITTVETITNLGNSGGWVESI